MAVSIDTVYQRVLTLANKEQRGYITPQEFNLLANQAQLEIFEQYFADVAVLSKSPGNTHGLSDSIDTLYEKIGIFERQETTWWTFMNMPVLESFGNAGYTIQGSPSFAKYIVVPEEIYKIDTIRIGGKGGAGTKDKPAWGWGKHLAELVNVKDFESAMLSPLTAPTLERPIYCMTTSPALPYFDEIPEKASGVISIGVGKEVYATPRSHGVSITFIQKPKKVEWAYVIVNDKALYNDNISVDFELHPSEEVELVYKILKLSAFNLKAPDVVQGAAGLESANKQTTL